MATRTRTRRIAPDAPVAPPAPLPTLARTFTAITFEHVLDVTPVLRFYDAAGKTIVIGLSPDADKIWRRMIGRR